MWYNISVNKLRKVLKNDMKTYISLEELRDYRNFIINYKSTSKMVHELKDLLGCSYWVEKDFGDWLQAVSLFADKTLNGKCSWQQYKHPTTATRKFLKAILDYQTTVLK